MLDGNYSRTASGGPAKIRTFGAFPFMVIELRGFFYNCTEREFAQLQECNAGTIYNPEIEMCSSGARAMSRIGNLRQGSSQAAGKIKRKQGEKVLNRGITLGAFYYGENDEIDITKNFWKKSTINKLRRKETITITKKSNVFASDFYLDRVNNLDVSASLSLSFMGGLITAEGGAHVLLKTRHTIEQEAMTYQISTRHLRESLTPEMKNEKDLRDECRHVGKKHGPTHVVSSIYRGFEGYFTFIRTKQVDDEQTYVSGWLKAVVDKFPTLKIEAKVNLTVDQDEALKLNRLEVSYTGDGTIGPITHLQDALREYKGIIDQSKDASRATNPIEFDLVPISDFCDSKDLLLLKIGDSITAKATVVYDTFELIELMMTSYIRSELAKLYPQFIGKFLSNYNKEFSKFKSDWIKKFSVLLPQLRGGGKAEAELIDLIQTYTDSRFEFFTAKRFLGYRNKEIKTLSFFLKKEAGPTYSVFNEVDESSNKCVFNSPNFFLRLKVVSPDRTHLLSKFLSTGANKEKDWKDWENMEKWIDDEALIQKASVKYQLFMKLFDQRTTFHLKDDHCFVVKIMADSTIANKGELAVRLEITAKGDTVVKDYALPEKLEEKKDMTSLKTGFLPRAFIKIQIRYKYRPYVSTGLLVKLFGGTGTEKVNDHIINNSVGLTEGLNIDAITNLVDMDITQMQPFTDYYLSISAYSVVGIGESACWGPINAEGSKFNVKCLLVYR